MISQTFFFLWPASFEVKKYIKIWSEASSFMWFLDISLAVVHFQCFIKDHVSINHCRLKQGGSNTDGCYHKELLDSSTWMFLSVQSKVQPNNKISQSDTQHSKASMDALMHTVTASARTEATQTRTCPLPQEDGSATTTGEEMWNELLSDCVAVFIFMWLPWCDSTCNTSTHLLQPSWVIPPSHFSLF